MRWRQRNRENQHHGVRERRKRWDGHTTFSSDERKSEQADETRNDIAQASRVERRGDDMDETMRKASRQRFLVQDGKLGR